MLLLLRHGETDANARGLLLGRSDPSLTETGQAQARTMAEAVPRPSRVISSPLRRARETAAAFGLEVQIDDRWTELDYGEFDGQPAGAVPDDVWERWRADATFAPNGAEALADLSSRVRHACADLATSARDSTIAIVTHVSPIKAAIAWALGVSDAIAWRMYVEDAGVARIDIEDRGPVVRWFNRGSQPCA